MPLLTSKKSLSQDQASADAVSLGAFQQVLRKSRAINPALASTEAPRRTILFLIAESDTEFSDVELFVEVNF